MGDTGLVRRDEAPRGIHAAPQGDRRVERPDAGGPAGPTTSADAEIAPTGLDLSVVMSARPGTRPAMLVLPGGGYEGHADNEAEPVGAWLATAGVHAFVLRYRVAPHRHPAALDDARRALDWIRRGPHGVDVDPERVGVLGFSAGGHLAASLSNGSPAPDLCVLAYPVISFVDEPHIGSIKALLGPGEDATTRAALSPDRHVSPSTPPTFLWHTADDDAVSVGHSLRHASALASVGVPFELHVFPNGPHGLGLAEEKPDVARWTELCETWLATLGWLTAAQQRPPSGRRTPVNDGCTPS